MAATEAAGVTRLDVSDAASGLLLSAEAHWNQNEADWRYFLRQGVVFGVRDAGDRLVATAALLPHGTSDAWISMVLVTESWRRRGLATRLVDRCLGAAKEMKLTTWLDATPAGAAVYGPLGFARVSELRRLRLQGSRAEKVSPKLRTCTDEELIARDRAATGLDRSTLLTELSSRTGSTLAAMDDAIALVRDGRTARHIGPLFAPDDDRALALVDDIAAREPGPILIDAVASHERFVAGLVERGWSVERPFQRMRFGGGVTRSGESPFAVAGPEFG